MSTLMPPRPISNVRVVSPSLHHNEQERSISIPTSNIKINKKPFYNEMTKDNSYNYLKNKFLYHYLSTRSESETQSDEMRNIYIKLKGNYKRAGMRTSELSEINKQLQNIHNGIDTRNSVYDEATAYFRPLKDALEIDGIIDFDIEKLVANITSDFILTELFELDKIEGEIINIIQKNSVQDNVLGHVADYHINMARINSLENKISNRPEKSSFITNTLKEELFSSKRKYQDSKVSIFPEITSTHKKIINEKLRQNKNETDAIVDKIAKNNQSYIKCYVPNHSDNDSYNSALKKLKTFGPDKNEISLIENARKDYINAENTKNLLEKSSSEIKSAFKNNKKTDNYTLGDEQLIIYSEISNNDPELRTIKVSAGDLYTDICLQKAAASTYLKEIRKSERFDKNEALTLFANLAKNIDNLQDGRRRSDSTGKRKEIIDRLAVMEKILIKEESDITTITEHSVDFLLVKKDENGLFHEKQGDNGTCALHRNNAIIASKTNNTQLLQTPYRIEVFARAELFNTMKDITDYIKSFKVDANGTPEITLTDLLAQLKKIQSNKYCTDITSDGFVMNYENTGEWDMKVKKNNLNTYDAGIMESHGFNKNNIIPLYDNHKYTFLAGEETEAAIKGRLSNLDAEMEKYDAISVNIKTTGNQGQHASHAVCFIKDKNKDFYFSDPHTGGTKAKISDFIESFLSKSSKPYLSETIDTYKKRGYTQLKFTFAFTSPDNQ